MMKLQQLFVPEMTWLQRQLYTLHLSSSTLSKYTLFCNGQWMNLLQCFLTDSAVSAHTLVLDSTDTKTSILSLCKQERQRRQPELKRRPPDLLSNAWPVSYTSGGNEAKCYPNIHSDGSFSPRKSLAPWSFPPCWGVIWHASLSGFINNTNIISWNSSWWRLINNDFR